MKQVFNPYLPLIEYVPDGEPHVFGDRVYIYGSHDRAGGEVYCEQHYQVWSAPVNDLKDWRNEGVSYLRTQDPSNKDDSLQLWAPDVTKGPDGRYYIYYCFSFYPEVGVAVSDNPAGPFTFYGHVHYPEHILGGKILQEGMVFDPAVLTDDDGRVYLYYGFAPAQEKEMHKPETKEELQVIPEPMRSKIEKLLGIPFSEYSMVVELEQDMLTVKEMPKEMIPGGHHTAGTGFEGHGFFEASSIRKIRGKYYFVYSSHKSHELCYAVSDKPDEGFVYGGTVISNGNVGYKGQSEPTYPLGNNHGGIIEVNGEIYIFYHRQTNGTECSRQGCAERIEINKDGLIEQVQTTSCGLNNAPLTASGIYPAAIACHLVDPTVKNKIDYMDLVMKSQIRITEVANDSFVTAVGNHASVGYRYFLFEKPVVLGLELRGDFKGTIRVSSDENGKVLIGSGTVTDMGDFWKVERILITPEKGESGLYLWFDGEGRCNLRNLIFEENHEI